MKKIINFLNNTLILIISTTEVLANRDYGGAGDAIGDYTHYDPLGSLLFIGVIIYFLYIFISEQVIRAWNAPKARRFQAEEKVKWDAKERKRKREEQIKKEAETRKVAQLSDAEKAAELLAKHLAQPKYKKKSGIVRQVYRKLKEEKTEEGRKYFRKQHAWILDENNFDIAFAHMTEEEIKELEIEWFLNK